MLVELRRYDKRSNTIILLEERPLITALDTLIKLMTAVELDSLFDVS